MKIRDVLWVFFISILPIIELRGAIPVGAALDLPFYVNYACAVVGNILPIPFILMFIPKVLEFLNRFKIFKPIIGWVYKKAQKYSAKIEGEGAEINTETGEIVKKNNEGKMSLGAFVALLLFVMIPLPGTGAWTGALIASLFGLPKKKSFLAILLGVLCAGVLMCLASYGVVSFLKIFL